MSRKKYRLVWNRLKRWICEVEVRQIPKLLSSLNLSNASSQVRLRPRFCGLTSCSSSSQHQYVTSGYRFLASAHISCFSAAELPVNYGMIIFPNFQTLDVFGPLEVLTGLSRYFRMNLRIIAPTMNLTSQSATSAAMNTTGSDYSFHIKPTHTFDNPPEDLEVLIIPGGGWTRSPDVPPVLEYVKEVFPKLKYLITVCTGSMIAARAGVLDGLNATTNKAAWKEVTSKRAEVNWIPKARWVVDGNVWTTSGVSLLHQSFGHFPITDTSGLYTDLCRHRRHPRVRI